MQKRLEQFFFWVLVALLFYTPIRELIYIFLGDEPAHAVVVILKFVPELIPIGGIAAAIAARWLVIKRPPAKSLVGLAAVAMLGWTALTLLWSVVPLWQSLRGLRVDFGGLAALIILWLIPFEAPYRRRLMYAIVAAFGFLTIFNIPELINNSAWRDWSHQTFERHYVSTIPQIRSLTPGPNPYGTLLVILATLCGYLFRGRTRIISVAIAGILLGLTYGRSAWLAATVLGAGVFFAGLIKKRVLIWPVVLGVAIVVGAGFGILRYSGSLEQVATHGSSTSEHEKISLKNLGSRSHSAAFIIAIGDGIGTAGPVTFGTNRKTISESWYIQLIQELGVVGLAIYLAFYVITIRELFKKNYAIFGWLAIGIGVNSIFLHTWSGDFDLNTLFWTLVGACIFIPKRATDSTSSAPTTPSRFTLVV